MIDLETKVRQLAAELEEDIRGRGLICGDRYLTTAEASRMLGARRATVNHAMQLLVERDMLVRRRRVGTVVGPRMGRRRTREIFLVKVVMPVERIGISGPLDNWVHGLHRTMPGIDVQFCFVRTDDPSNYIKSIVTNVGRTYDKVGFLLASCPREVHRGVKLGGSPAVVVGSGHSESSDLPSVDVDNFQVGRLVAEYAVERGHRRIGYLAFEHWRPGDNLLIDGINSRLSEEGLGADSLRVRCLPNDPELIESESKRLLQHPDQPTAIIGRTLRYAEAAWRAAGAINVRVPEELLVVSGDGEGSKAARSRFPFIQSAVDHRRVAELAGELLSAQFNKQPIKQPQIRIDVKLVDPFCNTVVSPHSN